MPGPACGSAWYWRAASEPVTGILAHRPDVPVETEPGAVAADGLAGVDGDDEEGVAVSLTLRQRAFVDEYFLCGMNATEAARRLGYSHPNQQGPRLLVNVGISEEINCRLKEKQLSADEVLARLGDMARSDIADFAKLRKITDLQNDEYRGKTHVIKKFKSKTAMDALGRLIEEVELELYPADGALEKIGRHHKLFTDKIELSWRDKLPPDTNPDEVLKQFAGLLALAAQRQDASND